MVVFAAPYMILGKVCLGEVWCVDVSNVGVYYAYRWTYVGGRFTDRSVMDGVVSLFCA